MGWKAKIEQIWNDQTGATAVEYGLILSLIFLAMAVAVEAVADSTVGLWRTVEDTIVEATTNS